MEYRDEIIIDTPFRFYAFCEITDDKVEIIVFTIGLN
jgi:hypothetical protein